MYFYVEVGNHEEIKQVMNLSNKPTPAEIKKLPNGKPAVRPLVIDEPAKREVQEIYEMSAPEMIVEDARVVKKFTLKLRENYKQILKDRVSAIANMARQNVLSKSEIGGSGLLIKMVMDEEGEEFLAASEEERTKDRFPLVFAATGFLAETTEEVAKAFRKAFTDLKVSLAEVEGELFRLHAAIDKATNPDAALRAFESRAQAFKQVR